MIQTLVFIHETKLTSYTKDQESSQKTDTQKPQTKCHRSPAPPPGSLGSGSQGPWGQKQTERKTPHLSACVSRK